MIYEFPITTTTAYTKDSPKKTIVKLTKGIIHELDIISDEACQWTLFVAVAHGLHQIYPTNQGEYFKLRGETFSFREYYNLDTRPFSFYIYTYLYDADNSHDCVVRIGLLREVDLKEVIIKWSAEEEYIK